MASKLVTCEHCEGKKNCMRSGGRSCQDCMMAAGVGKRQWATVRCSYCGGKGKVWMKEEEAAAAAEAGTEEVAGAEVGPESEAAPPVEGDAAAQG
jgi:hypothetical protein